MIDDNYNTKNSETWKRSVVPHRLMKHTAVPYGRKDRRLRFRFNVFNIILIFIISFASICVIIVQAQNIKWAPAGVEATVPPASTNMPASRQAGSTPLAPDESFKADPSNNHWVYTSPQLSVDIKKLHNDNLKIWYYVSDIRVKDPAAIKSGMSDESDPVTNRATPGDLAMKYKAIFSTNGDLFVARKTGVIIRNGKLWRNVPSEPILAFYPDGTMKVFDPSEKTAQQLLDEGVTNTFAFGPILIRDGAINHSALKKNPLRPPNPRTGIGMAERGHFISVLVEGRQPGYSEGITLDDFALLFQQLGCQTAYNLDGGQSAAMMFMGQPLNSHANDMNGAKWNTYRHVSEILIFGQSQLVPAVQSNYGTSP